MSLYFTIPYAFVWAISNQLLYYWKTQQFVVPLVTAVVSPMIFWVWFLMEPVRLLLGYVGNLREREPVDERRANRHENNGASDAGAIAASPL